MAQQLRPVYGIGPKFFNDHSGTEDDLYTPTTAQLNADAEALTYKSAALWVAPADGARVTEIRLCNTDTSNAVYVNMFVGTAYNAKRFMGCVDVAAKAGTDGVVAAGNGLSGDLFPSLPMDAAGNRFLELEAGETLFFEAETADKIKSAVTILSYTAPV